MFAVLAHIRPLDASAKQRIDVRVSSAPGGAYNGLGGFVWEPAISRRPVGTIELFPLDLSPGTLTASATMEISLPQIMEVDTTSLVWSGATIILYRGDSMVWPAPIDMQGIITDVRRDLDTDKLSISIKVQTDAMDVPLLASEFTGAGGFNGEPELMGVAKPAGFGNVPSVPPVFFDNIRNIGMLDGYGNMIAVDTLYESGVSLGPSVGNFADYAALAAAIDNKTIPPGRWGTANASGIVGLGAPPDGVITCDARFGFGMSGAMIARMLVTHAKIPAARVDAAAFASIDVAVPFPVHFWTADQQQVKDTVESLAAGTNSSMLVTFQNVISIVRPFGGKSIGSLVRYGYSEPAVTSWATNETVSPIWRIKARVARPARVLTLEEIRFVDDIINRGPYSATESYRQGNTVWTDDGAQWLWINETAAAGQAPPVTLAPDANGNVGNAYWKRIKAPTTAQVAQAYKDAAPVGMGPYKKGDIVRDQDARWIYTADIAWDGTRPPALPAQGNAFWTLVKDATTITLRANVTSIVIQADYTNTPNAGQLPAVGRGILTVGAVDASASAAWTVATSGCTATIAADGSFQISAVTSSGYLDIKASYGGTVYTTRVTIALNAAGAPAGGGSGGTSATISAFPSVTVNTYPSAPTNTATLASGSAGINFSLALTYSASSATNGKISRQAVLYAKIVYRVNGSGSGWTDVAGEVAGSEASSGAYPDYESYDGNLNVNQGLTGIVANTVYEFGVLLRRVGNSPTTPTGALTARQAT